MRGLIVQVERSGIAGGARVARVARLGANDGAFDQQVVRPADHQQVLDVVPADDDKLAMTIKVVSVDNAKSRLARPCPAAQSRAKQGPHQKHQHKQNNENGGQTEKPEKHPVVAGQIGQEFHVFPLACAKARTQNVTNLNTFHAPAGWNVNQWLTGVIQPGRGRMFPAFLG